MLDMDDCHAFLMEGYPANIEQSKAFEEEVKTTSVHESLSDFFLRKTMILEDAEQDK